MSARTEAVVSGAAQMSASIGEICSNTAQASTHTSAAVYADDVAAAAKQVAARV